MNYLAHLLLAEPTEDSRLGGLIGDFMGGYGLDAFAPGVQRGIRRHRRIDAITDGHPTFRRSRARLAPWVGRYSGVVADIVYDHFLAVHWNDWHDEPLATFTAAVYRSLERRFDELPVRLQRALPWLVGEDWLRRYADPGHLRRVFAGLAGRARRANPLAAAFPALCSDYDGLRADFIAFFPQLRAVLAAPAAPPAQPAPTTGRTTRTP